MYSCTVQSTKYIRYMLITIIISVQNRAGLGLITNICNIFIKLCNDHIESVGADAGQLKS